METLFLFSNRHECSGLTHLCLATVYRNLMLYFLSIQNTFLNSPLTSSQTHRFIRKDQCVCVREMLLLGDMGSRVPLGCLFLSCLWVLLYIQELRPLAWSVTPFLCSSYDLFFMCHELWGSAPRHPGYLRSLFELEASLLYSDVIHKQSHSRG